MLSSTISSFERYFKDFEQRFEKQEKENDALKLKIENLQETTNKIKKKQVDVETRINKQKNVDFETKIKYLESTVKKLDKSNDIFIVKIDKLESRIKIDEKKKYKCSECNFESISERGLKGHVGRKHQEENGKYPRTCDLCDLQLKNVKDMKKHKLSHSYNRVEFKCEECDFYGTDDLAMEMHYKKTHSDIFECVLCEYVLKDEESLELHTFTCEAYRCNECELNVKTLNMLKKHIIDKHDGQCVHIFHVKQDRKNKEELVYTHHKSEDLFPDLNL